MGKHSNAPGAWRASRGSIAAVAVMVFLAVSTRPVFADVTASTRAYLSGHPDFGVSAGLAASSRDCRSDHADK